MDGTIRVRTAAWFATAVVLSVFATVLVMERLNVSATVDDRLRLPTEEEARAALAKIPPRPRIVT
jgi:hypothetical protein